MLIYAIIRQCQSVVSSANNINHWNSFIAIHKWLMAILVSVSIVLRKMYLKIIKIIVPTMPNMKGSDFNNLNGDKGHWNINGGVEQNILAKQGHGMRCQMQYVMVVSSVNHVKYAA